MAKGDNNGRNKKSHGYRPYDSSRSSIERLKDKVYNFLPNNSWLKGWLTPTAQPSENIVNQENVDEDEEEEEVVQPPAPKRHRATLDHERNHSSYSGSQNLNADNISPIAVPSTGFRYETPVDLAMPGPSGFQRHDLKKNEFRSDIIVSSTLLHNTSKFVPEEKVSDETLTFSTRNIQDKTFSFRSQLSNSGLTNLRKHNSARKPTKFESSFSLEKPSFDSSALSISFKNINSRHTSKDSDKLTSPFYSGITMYGGASSALNESILRNNTIPEILPTVLTPSRTSSVNSKRLDTSLGPTAKKIYKALEMFSPAVPVRRDSPSKTGLMTAKRKLPQQYNELNVPQIADLIRIKRREHELNSAKINVSTSTSNTTTVPFTQTGAISKLTEFCLPSTTTTTASTSSSFSTDLFSFSKPKTNLQNSRLQQDDNLKSISEYHLPSHISDSNLKSDNGFKIRRTDDKSYQEIDSNPVSLPNIPLPIKTLPTIVISQLNKVPAADISTRTPTTNLISSSHAVVKPNVVDSLISMSKCASVPVTKIKTSVFNSTLSGVSDKSNKEYLSTKFSDSKSDSYKYCLPKEELKDISFVESIKPNIKFSQPKNELNSDKDTNSFEKSDNNLKEISAKKQPNQSVTATVSGFGDKFKLSSDKWECEVCLVPNSKKDVKCVACGCNNSKKPEKSSISKVIVVPVKSNFGDKFKPPSHTWECGTCLIRNNLNDKCCVACGGAKPNSTNFITQFKKSESNDTIVNANPELNKLMEKFQKPDVSLGSSISKGVENICNTTNLPTTKIEEPSISTNEVKSVSSSTHDIVQSSQGVQFTFRIPKITSEISTTSPVFTGFKLKSNSIPDQKDTDLKSDSPAVDSTNNIQKTSTETKPIFSFGVSSTNSMEFGLNGPSSSNIILSESKSISSDLELKENQENKVNNELLSKKNAKRVSFREPLTEEKKGTTDNNIAWDPQVTTTLSFPTTSVFSKFSSSNKPTVFQFGSVQTETKKSETQTDAVKSQFTFKSSDALDSKTLIKSDNAPGFTFSNDSFKSGDKINNIFGDQSPSLSFLNKPVESTKPFSTAESPKSPWLSSNAIQFSNSSTVFCSAPTSTTSVVSTPSLFGNTVSTTVNPTFKIKPTETKFPNISTPFTFNSAVNDSSKSLFTFKGADSVTNTTNNKPSFFGTPTTSTESQPNTVGGFTFNPPSIQSGVQPTSTFPTFGPTSTLFGSSSTSTPGGFSFGMNTTTSGFGNQASSAVFTFGASPSSGPPAVNNTAFGFGTNNPVNNQQPNTFTFGSQNSAPMTQNFDPNIKPTYKFTGGQIPIFSPGTAVGTHPERKIRKAYRRTQK